MKTWTTFGALLAVALFWISPAAARTFQIPIEISTPVGATSGTEAPKAYNRLVLGVHPDATDGYDLQWETPAFFNTPDPEASLPLKAYMEHPDYGPAERQLWRDIRAGNGEKRWDMTITLAPSQVGKTVTVAWNLPPALSASQDRAVLSDPDTRATIDMRTRTEYAFIGSSTTPKVLRVTVSPSSDSSGGGSGFWGCGTIRSAGPGGEDPPIRIPEASWSRC